MPPIRSHTSITKDDDIHAQTILIFHLSLNNRYITYLKSFGLHKLDTQALKIRITTAAKPSNAYLTTYSV